MIRFDKTEFQKAFAMAARASNSKLKEVLGYVRVKADGSTAALHASDSEVFVRTTVACEGAGDLLLPASRTLSILAEGAGDTLSIDASKHGIKLVCGDAEFELATSDPSEFPPSPVPAAGSVSLSVQSQMLRNGFRYTDYAVDVASTRYQLGGVGIDVGAGVVCFVATDGRRLAVYESATIGDCAARESVAIVPAKACKIIEAAIGEHDGPVTLQLSTSLVRVEFEGVAVAATLVEGRYPNWRMVEPDVSTAVQIVLPAKAFFSAVRQASIVSDPESRGIEFAIHDGEMELSARTADVGAGSVRLPVAYTGDALKVTLDGRFVADFLKVLDPVTTVEMLVKTATEPVVLRTGDSLRYVLMPMSKT